MPFELGEEYLGTWEPFVYDNELSKQVWLRIRPLTEAHNEKVQKKYGKPKMNKRQGVRQRVVPPKNQKAVGTENIVFMLTGVRNFHIKVTNEVTASFFGERLKQEVKVGETIELPEDLWHPHDLDRKAPRPFDEIKNMMIQQDIRISSKVIDIGMGTDDDAVEAEEEEKEEVEKEKELTKNLQATSSLS
jgi:hypothetical protein